MRLAKLKYSFKRSTAIALLTLVTLFISGCDYKQPVHRSEFDAFGTTMDLTLIGIEKDKAESISEIIKNDFATMHSLWHAWEPGQVVRINQLIAAGETFSAPPSVLPLLRESIRLSLQSESLFNPAIGKLIGLWGFHADEPNCERPPKQKFIKALVDAAPKMSDIQLDGIQISSSNDEIELDFGAIGRGYGIDKAIERLRELGVENAVVSAGGDIRAIGSRDGHPWRIAVKSASGSGIAALIHVNGDESIFTSGNYERYFTWRSKHYHHIIDPRTGHPAAGTASVTVIHNNGTTADAAATALFVAGPKDWHRIAKKMGIRYVMLIDSEGVIHMNPAMAERAHLQSRAQTIKISEPLF